MNIWDWWLIIQIWLVGLIVILVSIITLSILNLLPSIHFKWSLRFLYLGKLIMLGLGYLIYLGVKPLT